MKSRLLGATRTRLISSIMAIAFAMPVGAATSFSLTTVFDSADVSNITGSINWLWVLTNTGSETFDFTKHDVALSADMDFGTLPVQSPKFTFNSTLLESWVRAPGESVGYITENQFINPPFPVPTFEENNHLFVMDAVFVIGSGSGSILFTLNDQRIEIPYSLEVVDKPFGGSQHTTGVFYSSTVPPPQPYGCSPPA